MVLAQKTGVVHPNAAGLAGSMAVGGGFGAAFGPVGAGVGAGVGFGMWGIRNAVEGVSACFQSKTRVHLINETRDALDVKAYFGDDMLSWSPVAIADSTARVEGCGGHQELWCKQSRHQNFDMYLYIKDGPFSRRHEVKQMYSPYVYKGNGKLERALELKPGCEVFVTLRNNSSEERSIQVWNYQYWKPTELGKGNLYQNIKAGALVTVKGFSNMGLKLKMTIASDASALGKEHAIDISPYESPRNILAEGAVAAAARSRRR